MRSTLTLKNPQGKLFIFSLIYLLFLLSPNIAFSQTPPNAPKQQYWVTDQANILSSSVELQLTKDAKAHEKNTTNQVVIVTVKSLDGWTIERYGQWLGNHWGIGQKGKNNGVLLLVAPNERKVRIEVGTGLEGVITNSIAKSIIDYEIVPKFKKGEMENGVINGHRAIIEALGGKYTDRRWWDVLVSFILFPFFFIGRLLGLGGDFSGGGGSFSGGGASGSW